MLDMKRGLAVMALLFGLVFGQLALAEDAPSAEDQAAIQGVIASQIEAFRAGDGETAYSFAAPIIKQKFRTAEVFMDMVRQGYSPVYAPQAFDFGANAQRGEEIAQEVILTAADGSQVLALYRLQRMEDGSWKISGVFLKEMPDQLT